MLTLRDTSLNWALQHALNFGDTDAFPLPFEDRAIHLFGGGYQVILVEPDNWHDGRSFSWAPGERWRERREAKRAGVLAT